MSANVEELLGEFKDCSLNLSLMQVTNSWSIEPWLLFVFDATPPPLVKIMKSPNEKLWNLKNLRIEVQCFDGCDFLGYCFKIQQ